MARLPVSGSDDGTWGDILNDFLSTQHNADGTHNLALNNLTNVNTAGATNGQVLKFNGTTWTADTDLSGGGDPTMGGDLSGTASNAQIVADAVGTTEIADGQVTEPKLSSAVQTKLNQAAPVISVNTQTGVVVLDKTDIGLANVDNTSDANKPISTATQTALDAKVDDSEKGAASGVATLDSGTKVPVAQLPDATTTTKGIVQLAGDLAGTAEAPTVPGLAGKINTSEKGAPNGVAELDGSGKIIPGQLQTANITKVLPYSYLGSLAVGTGAFRLYNDMGATWTISGVRASVGTAPEGASVIVDVNKNGTTIFTTQANRPTIADGANTSGNVTNMDVTTVAVGEYLTIDIDQVGSTVTGSDLTVQVEVV